jgi:hypothetical protein
MEDRSEKAGGQAMAEHPGEEGVGVRNACLRRLLTEYYRIAAAMLNGVLEEECEHRDAFVDVKPRFDFGADGGVAVSDAHQVNWQKLVSRNNEALENLAEYRRLLKAMAEDEVIVDCGVRQSWLSALFGLCPDVRHCIEKLLVDLLYEQDGGFEEGVFDRFYGRVEDFFYADRVQLRYLAPLGGFSMEQERIELDSRLSVIRIPDTERSEMLSAVVGVGPPPSWPHSWLRTHGVELHLDVENRVAVGDRPPDQGLETDPTQTALGKCERVCSVLRLFKGGEVGFDHVRGRTMCWHPAGGTFAMGRKDVRRFSSETYVLAGREVDQFMQFWKWWWAAERREQLDLAVRRFNQGCERRLPEDRLIDYVIALEALLLPDEKIGEYRYRLSLRGAALLGDDPLDRAAVKRNLAKAYDIRSGIVHGSMEAPTTVTWSKKPESGEKPATDEIAFGDFVDSVSDYLRALVKELGQRVGGKKLVTVLQEDIDDAIAKGFATWNRP